MAAVKVAKGTRVNADPVGYRGRNTNLLDNIGQVSAGNAFNAKITTGNRKHNTKLFCAAVNYTGGVALPIVKVTGAGNGAATATPTLTAGREPIVLAVVGGGAGFVTADIVTFTDATGTGAQYTVTAVAGAITALAYIVGSATASPVEPDFMFTQLAVQIAGKTPIQVDPIFFAMRRQFVGVLSPLGELSLDYTDPRRNWLRNNDVTSWDTVGAKTMTITGKINPNVVKPIVTGNEEFDFLRNSITNTDGSITFFQNPVKYVQQNIQLIAGQASINNLTVFGKLSRLYVRCATTPGTISYIELWCDGQKRIEGNTVDIAKSYEAYEFNLGLKNGYSAANIATSNTLKAALNPINYFDAVYISDFDQREGDALTIQNLDTLQLKLTSSVAQAATVYMECLPGEFD